MTVVPIHAPARDADIRGLDEHRHPAGVPIHAPARDADLVDTFVSNISG